MKFLKGIASGRRTAGSKIEKGENPLSRPPVSLKVTGPQPPPPPPAAELKRVEPRVLAATTQGVRAVAISGIRAVLADPGLG